MSVHFTHQLEHLDLIASAPEGVKRLRELILELAVRGKLVPQDPNDEPASELLKRIQAEKAKLVTQGRIKKDKPLAEIGEEEKPFELPVGWEWVRLATVAGFENGDRSKNYPSRDQFVAQGIPFINAGHLQNQQVDFTDMNFIPSERYDMLRAGKVREGDILFCLRGSLGKFAVVPKIDHAAIASSLVIIRAATGDLLPFALGYFSSPLISRLIAMFDNGTAQPNLAANDLAKFPLPLPPLAEQHRIVAKVDELMALCDRLEAQQTDAASAHTTLVKTLLDTLTLPNHLLSHASAQRPDRSGRPVRSATGPGSGYDQTPISPGQSDNDFTANWRRLAQHFDTLITTEASVTALKQTLLQLAVMGKLVPQDPNDEPASELLKRIQAEKAKLVAEGKIKKDKPLPEVSEVEKPFELPDWWMWVRMQSVFDVRDGTHDTPKYVEYDGVPLITSRNFQGGKICFSDAKLISWNDHNNIKKRSAVDMGDILYSMIGGNIGNQVLVDTDREFSIKNVALFKYFSKPDTLAQYLDLFLRTVTISLQASAVGGAQPFVSLGLLRNIPFALPPLPEQHRIVAKIDELMALCDHLASRLKAARELSAKYATVVTETALESAAGHAAIA